MESALFAAFSFQRTYQNMESVADVTSVLHAVLHDVIALLWLY